MHCSALFCVASHAAGTNVSYKSGDPHTEPSQSNSYFALIIQRTCEIAYFLILLHLHLLATSGEKIDTIS
jgi:hypothetical protein